MTVLVTGGFGLVGRAVVRNLLLAGHSVRLFDTQRASSPRRLLSRLSAPVRARLRHLVLPGRKRRERPAVRPCVEYVHGDICNIAHVGNAAKGVDAVVHLAALIPPAADQKPEYADYVNRGGTEILVRACEKTAPAARFVFSSSVAVYGDRRHNPQIRLQDKTHPEDRDSYAAGKLAAETTLRSSSLDWTIFRLSAIASPDKLALDPLLFEMPLETKIEWCTAEDAGLALARAVDCPAASRQLFHLAGGPSCRTTFREYVDRVLEIMGLGRGFLPDEAFGLGPFHCGYMDAFSAQDLFKFQNHSLEDYYADVDQRVRWRRPVIRLLRPLIRAYLLDRSPYWRKYTSSNPITARRRDRFGWIFAGKRAHQPM